MKMLGYRVIPALAKMISALQKHLQRSLTMLATILLQRNKDFLF